MRKAFPVSLAVAALLLVDIAADGARAMTAGKPLGVAGPALVQPVRVLCGSGGCAPVQTKQIVHHRNLPKHI
jgi:hypothetical protein